MPPFNVLSFAIASALTKDLEDRDRASQLSLLGGVLGNSPIGLVLVASAAQERDSGTGTGTGPRPALVAVPDVSHQTVGAAKRILSARRLKPVVDKVAHEDPIGEVLETDPRAGTIVALGSTVRIAVSAGLIVPDVLGMDQQEAEGFVEEAGFAPAVNEAENPGEEGVVQAQEPAGGSLLAGGSEVVLYVVGVTTREARKASGTKKQLASADKT